MNKPRLKYQEVFGLNYDALEWGKSKLLLEGHEFTYEGDSLKLVWLRKDGKLYQFRKENVQLRLA